MAQIIPQTGLGERLGTALGTGLGTGLQQLAQLKLQDFARQQQFAQQQQQAQQMRPGIESLLGSLGFNEQQSSGMTDILSRRPELLKNIIALPGAQQAAQAKLQSAQIKAEGGTAKDNARYINNLSKRRTQAQTAKSKIQNLRKLLESGRVAGPTASLVTPQRYLSDESRLFINNARDLILAAARSISARPSETMLKMLEDSKPDLSMSKEANLERLAQMEKEIDEVLHESDVASQFRNQFGLSVPDLENKVLTYMGQQGLGRPDVYEPPQAPSEELKKKDLDSTPTDITPQGEDGDQQSMIGRLGGVAGTSAVDAVAGLPGNIASSIQGLGKFVESIGDFFTGGALSRFGAEQQAALEEQKSGLPESISKMAGKGLLDVEDLPTSDRIRDLREQYVGGKQYRPQNAVERGLREFIENASYYALPAAAMGNVAKAAKQVKNVAPMLAGAQAVKEAVRELGLGETPAALSHIAVMSAPSVYNVMRGGIRSLMENINDKQYNGARKALEKAGSLQNQPAQRLNEKMLGFWDEVNTGAKEWKDRARKVLANVNQNISQGSANVGDIWQTKMDINAHIRKAREGKEKEYIKFLQRLSGSLTDWVKDSGAKIPDFLENWSPAEVMKKNLSQMSSIRKFFQSNKDLLPKVASAGIRSGLFSLIGFKAGGIPGAVIGTALGAGAPALGRNVSGFFEMIWRIPKAQKALVDVLQAAASNNRSEFVRGMKRLSKFENQSS